MSIDYASTAIPDEDEKPPEDWHYTERRAWILREIKRKGTPAAVSRVETADRFEVDHSQTSRDITARGYWPLAVTGSRWVRRPRWRA